MERTHPPSGSDGLVSRRAVLSGSLALAAAGLSAAACGGSGTKKTTSGTTSAKTGASTGANTGPNTTAFSAGPVKGGTPVRGGTLRVGVVTAGDAETISVFTGVSTPDIIRIYALHDPMFFPAEGGKVTGGLVEKAVPNASATVWTFHLRRGVTFHNGKPFNADDIVYTITKSWANKANSYNAVLSNIVDFAGVRKLDNYTVRVPLKLGLAQFPSVTCILNCYVVPAGTTKFDSGIGTGPFKLVSFQPGQRSTFKANPNYWMAGRPYVDELVIDSSYALPQTCLNALLAGVVDVVPGVPPALAATSSKSGRLVLGNQPGPGFVAPVFRVDKAPFDDVRVRQALHLIPNRSNYTSVGFDGYAVAGNDCPGYTDQYWAQDLKAVHDPDKARSLLKAAGHENLALTLRTADIFPGQTATATLFKQDARAAGVTVNINQIAPATYYTSAQGFLTRDFSVTSYNTGVNSLATFYLTAMTANGPYNESHWGTKTAFGSKNALLFEALGEVDTAKAADKWHAVQEQESSEGPYIIPANTNWVDAYSPSVRGVQTTTALNCANFDFSGAWLAPK